VIASLRIIDNRLALPIAKAAANDILIRFPLELRYRVIVIYLITRGIYDNFLIQIGRRLFLSDSSVMREA